MTAPKRDVAEAVAGLEERLERTDRVSICLDFDGTLTPIVSDPQAVELDPAVRDVLRRLAQQPVVTLSIVSGRALADLRSRVGVRGIAYAGNHGLEVLRGGSQWVHPAVEEVRGALAAARDRIASELSPIPGAFLEDKGATLTIHYRTVPPAKRSAVQSIARRVAAEHHTLRWGSGKAVVQVRPDIQWDKGDAVRLLASTEPGTLVLVAGDDRTDVDAFKASQELPVPSVTIGVGEATLPTDLDLRSPAEMVTALRFIDERIHVGHGANE